MQRDPIVMKVSELMRLGLTPSAEEIKNGKVWIILISPSENGIWTCSYSLESIDSGYFIHSFENKIDMNINTPSFIPINILISNTFIKVETPFRVKLARLNNEMYWISVIEKTFLSNLLLIHRIMKDTLCRFMILMNAFRTDEMHTYNCIYVCCMG